MSIETASHENELAARNKRLASKLGAVLIGMSLFAWALVPIYRWVCTNYGVGIVQQKPDPKNLPAFVGSREVEVRFVGIADVATPATIEPLEVKTTVKVGEQKQVMYRFTNLSDKPLKFQAVHSVAPQQADALFHKLECFCFAKQELKPKETRVMPVTFWVDDKLPEQFHAVTLQYTLYNLHPDPAYVRSRYKAGTKETSS